MSRIVACTVMWVLLCSGCASVTQGTTHGLRIDTETSQGQTIDGAECELNNDQGTTSARSGETTIVRRSSKDLDIRCLSAGLPDASARLISRANAGLAGNIILGGAIGALVDHNSGAAYTYPNWVRLVFGEHAVLDRGNEREGTALAATPGSATILPMRTAPAALAAAPSSAVPAAAAVPVAAPLAAARSPGVLASGDRFDYQLVERMTRLSHTVMLRVVRVDDTQVLFNDGSRVEKPNGELVAMGPPILGELDRVTPPSGWMPGGRVPRGVWPLKFTSGIGHTRRNYDLTAQAGLERPIRIQAGQFQAVRVDVEGWLEWPGGRVTVRAPYRAVVWLSPELRRPIRFEVKSGTGSGSSMLLIDETAELTAISRD